MQYNERKTNPESNRNLMVQQVHEQSDLCDVIVKHGLWEKKFHRCVLVASPFFESALKNNFLEKQTGKIEITLGTANTIEMAIMFLYGKIPNLTEDNVEHMLQLAEFLMIPRLKASCVEWLRTIDITEDKCIHFLQLSSTFNLDIPTCTEYIEGHLSEMLKNPQMKSLTMDSLYALFMDQKLSYVSMDDKIKFLLEWRDSKNDENTMENFKELLATINFNEVSVSHLQDLRDNESLCDHIDLEQIVRNMNDIPDKHRVLVTKADEEDETLWCLDLERTKWFRLHSSVFEEESFDCFSDIAEQGNHEIYLTKFVSYRQKEILVFNLQSDSCRKIKLVDKESGEDFIKFNNLKILDNFCVLNVNEKTQINSEEDNFVYSSRMFVDRRKGLCRYTSTLYTGNKVGEKVHISPLVTFRDDEITKLCIGKTLTVAILFASNTYILLYNLVGNTMERLKVCTGWGDKLSPTDEGFVVYNNERCLCLTRLIGPSHSTKYVVNEISFKCERFYVNRYFLCGNTWYRYYRKMYNTNYMLESASNRSFISQPFVEKVDWMPLPLPIKNLSCDEYTITDKCFEIFLPKRKLRCDIECPHCRVSKRQSSSFTTNYDYYFNESSSSDDQDFEYYLDDSD